MKKPSKKQPSKKPAPPRSGKRRASIGDAKKTATTTQKPEKKADAKPRKVTKGARYCREIAVALTPDEFVARAIELATKMGEVHVLEEQKKAEAKEFADQIAEKEKEVERLRIIVKTKSEERETEVYDLKDFAAKKVRVCRADTDEVISERDMLSADGQTEIADVIERARQTGANDPAVQAEIARLEAEQKPDAANGTRTDRTEEQRIAATPEEAEMMRAERLEREAAERDDADAGRAEPSKMVSVGELLQTWIDSANTEDGGELASDDGPELDEDLDDVPPVELGETSPE